MRSLPAKVSASRGRLAWLALAAALLGACAEEAPPEAPRTAASDAVATAPPGSEAPSAYDGIELPPFEPLPPEPPDLVPPAKIPSPPPEVGAGGEPPAPEEVILQVPTASLDDLLRLPPGGERPARQGDTSVEPYPEEGAPAPAERAAPGTVDRLRRSVHVERRSEPIGPKGPRQGERSETDAEIRVPLDEDVTFEGGVRVDQREEPGLPEAERKSTPRVGVEVKF